MARTRRYMHGKRRRSPLKHHEEYPSNSSRAGQTIEHNVARDDEWRASRARREENERSGKVVTQPVSKYIKNAQNDLDALIRNGKSNTPQADKLRATITRLEGMQ